MFLGSNFEIMFLGSHFGSIVSQSQTSFSLSLSIISKFKTSICFVTIVFEIAACQVLKACIDLSLNCVTQACFNLQLYIVCNNCSGGVVSCLVC